MRYLFILTLLITGCTRQKVHSKNHDTDVIKKHSDLVLPVIEYYLTSKDTARYVFLNFDAKRDSSSFGKNVAPANLSLQEIVEIEKLISKQVSTYNKSHNGKYDRIKRPGKYFKQFITVINAKNEKLVWVNCMCEVLGNQWKKSIPVVMDGGSCYFQLKINLTKKVVYDFYANGLA